MKAEKPSAKVPRKTKPGMSLAEAAAKTWNVKFILRQCVMARQMNSNSLKELQKALILVRHRRKA